MRADELEHIQSMMRSSSSTMSSALSSNAARTRRTHLTDPLEDIEGSVYRYLLAVQQAFPGCGITVHNVWATPYIWWRAYVQHIDDLQEKN